MIGNFYAKNDLLPSKIFWQIVRSQAGSAGPAELAIVDVTATTQICFLF